MPACMPSARASGTNIHRRHLPIPPRPASPPSIPLDESTPCNRVCSTHIHKAMSAKSTTTAKAAAPNDQRPAKQSGAKNAYLLAYNAASAALWAGVLYQTVTIGANEVVNAQKAGAFFGSDDWFTATRRGLASGKVYDGLEGYTRTVQTLAGLEVLHSLVGTWLSSISHLHTHLFPRFFTP